MAKITVDNRLRVECSAEARDALMREFTYDNPERREITRLKRAVEAQPHNRKLRGMLAAAGKAPEKVATYAGGIGSEFTLARGSLERAIEVLEPLEGTTSIVDRRCDGDPRLGPVRGKLKFEPWDFQQRMLEAALAGTDGMVLGPTASGKTVFGFALAAAVQRPTLVLVWSSALMKDWIRRAQDELGLRADQVGYIAGKDRKIRPLTIAMVQTVVKHGHEFADLWGCVIADEIERFAAQSLYASGDVFPARFRIGIGAEYKRKDHKEFLTLDLFGPELIRVEREEVGDKILDVEHRLFETSFAPGWYVDTPQASRGFAFNQLLDTLMVNEERNRLLARMAAEEVRLGNPVLAFSHRREHVRMLEADLRREVPGLRAEDTGVMLGGPADAKEFERCTAAFRAKTLRYAGTTYQAASVGINLPSLPVGMCASPTHSNPSRFNQTQGRLRRIAEGKAGARLYVPWDRGCFGLAPLRASLRLAPERTKVLVKGEWIDGREVLRNAKEDAEPEVTGPDESGADDLITVVR